MAVQKFTISTTPELFEAIEALREARGQDRSALIEMLLREHPMVRKEIQRQRGQDTRPGRRRAGRRHELRALAGTARRQWEKRESAGEVAFLDR